MEYVLGTRGMHINSFYASIDKAYLSRYKYLHNIKDAKNGLINDYNMIYLQFHVYRIIILESPSPILSVSIGVCLYSMLLQQNTYLP